MQAQDLRDRWGGYHRVGRIEGVGSGFQVYECLRCGALVRVVDDTRYEWERIHDGRRVHDDWHSRQRKGRT